MSDDLLPSWRPGATRDALLRFLEESIELPAERRFACFDNDGTLWVERPTYIQLDFFVDVLRERVAAEPSLRDRAELAAVLAGDPAQIDAIGLERVVGALLELFVGMTPEEVTLRSRAFMSTAQHPLGRPARSAVYQPMLELIDELRRREFTVAIVSGGGVEFVRSVSQELYGVPPELVVGTQPAYEFGRDATGRPRLTRAPGLGGTPNEGPAKIAAIQSQLGRRPVLAAGNSAGDREMLEWACGGGEPCLAILVDHDDADREYRYASQAATFAETEGILDVAARSGWTTVSMARDWRRIFPDDR